MTEKRPELSVVPFVQRPVDPGRAGRVEEIRERLLNPEMKAAICIILDKNGEALMVSTNDDPMLVAYIYRVGDVIIGDYVAGHVGLDDIALDDEE